MPLFFRFRFEFHLSQIANLSRARLVSSHKSAIRSLPSVQRPPAIRRLRLRIKLRDTLHHPLLLLVGEFREHRERQHFAGGTF